MYDVISVGDTTKDVFLEVSDATVHCRLNEAMCQICFDHAAKIGVNKLTKISGVGNAANVSVGVTRLGLSSAIYTVVGDDQTGREIKELFKNEKLSTKYVVTDKERPSNYSVVINFQGERTILVYHEHRKYALPEFPRAKWLYYTSVAAGHDPLHKEIPSYVRRTNTRLAFNPGTYQLEEDVEKVKPVLEVTDLIFLNREEAMHFGGKSRDIRTLARNIQKLGPKVVVITDGPEGSYVLRDSALYYMGIFPSKMVERTGSGDSYASGFLSGLIQTEHVREAMRWGTFNASHVVQFIGAQEGLLRKASMTKMLNKHPRYTAKEL
ncbi:carbohydrate kinase family protein [Patescibacteria group bacterium]